MKIDPSVLNALPPEQHNRFIRNANEIVIESFIFTGDRDYLTARFAFFQKQSHLFLWSTAQTLEKYLKANILLLGCGAVRRTHEHTKLANILKATHPDRLEIDTAIQNGWKEQGLTFWADVDVDGFLQRIESLGSPDVRYDQIQLEVHLQDLVLLDRLAFRLRHQLITEPVWSCRLAGEQLKQCFFNFNYSFAPAEFNHPSLTGLTLHHSSVTQLEVALKGFFGCRLLYKEWAKNSLGMTEKDMQRLMKSTKDISNE
jgi:hypothetical protein